MSNTKAVDALPIECQKKYLSLMKDKNVFFFDMMKLCLDFGLRNEEARNLKVSEIDMNNCTITLSSSKQCKSFITKTAHKAIDAAWLKQGRKWLRENIDDSNISLIVRLANDVEGLASLAEEYDLDSEYAEAKLSHYKANIDEQRAIASKSAPRGRSVDYSRYPKAKSIIEKRMAQCEVNGSDNLFPANELSGSRAKAKGFDPVSRQCIYRQIERVKEQLQKCSSKIVNALKGVRIGLHSLRKSAVQKVANAIDLQAASLWVGHSDISVTQVYLNKSVKRMNEITEKLATLAA